MTKEDKMNKAKELAKILLAFEDVEDTPKEELKVGDAYEAEDGEHEKDGMIYVVKDNVITEIKEKPVEDTEDTPNVELEDDVVVEPEVENKPADVNTEPVMEDVLNMEGLAKLINLPNLQDGYISISASIAEGKLVWGEMYTEDYKILMSEQKADSDKKILELQEELKKSKEMNIALSEAKPLEKIVDAPVKGSEASYEKSMSDKVRAAMFGK